MKMNIRSIATASAMLVMSTVAGLAQNWPQSPFDQTKSSPVRTQNPLTGTEGSQNWTHNLYAHVDFGGSYQQNTTLDQSQINTSTNINSNGSAKFNLGIRANIAAGYNINKSWGVEFDTGLIWNSMDSVGGVSLNQPYPNNTSFDTYTVPLLVNIVYKFPLKGDLIPYVAAGAGGSASILSYSRAATSFTSSDIVFAYQAEVGLKYDFSKNASLGIAYQFLGTTDPSWHSVLTVGAAPPTDYQFKESGIYTHSIAVSLTWNF
jgi:opacity protein-like surface antigen